jgi:pentatricopeptide repeat protein
MVEKEERSSATAGLKKTAKLAIEKQTDSGRRLVEYFVVVSSAALSTDNENGAQSEVNASLSEQQTDSNSFDEEDEFAAYKFKPLITARYPVKDHVDNPLHDNLTLFCHPTGGVQLRTNPYMPKVHYFVATGGSGKQMYGTCLTLWEPSSLIMEESDGIEVEREVHLPKCLVILSTYPYLVAFREFLTQLNRLTKSGEMALPVERYIANFCAEIPAPPPGSFEVQTTIMESVIRMWSPPHNLPIAWVSLPFSNLFECLDIDNIILGWHCLVLERQVLITSTQISILTTACEIFLSLLFPMRWSHAYIPVLPSFLIPMLSAPMPFLCGINKANLADAMYDLSPECVLIDLDKNTVTLGPETAPLPPIPPVQEAELRAQLEENVGMIFREVRSLTKNDDFSNSGAHLSSHTKMMAEAMWESRLCLFDEAFHLAFTPEEARKNHLNGNDSSGLEVSDRDIANPMAMLAVTDQQTLRKQSSWDAVQEAFLNTFVYVLRNFRKYLVFPSKHNEGSYGGAGFRSKEFIESQRYDMREFLEQMIGTQMFDNFITKRLYGSGEPDVAFFDMAVDRFLKNAGLFADVDFGGRLFDATSNFKSRGTASKAPRNKRSTKPALVAAKLNENPLLQSAKVHRMLKTIVPPEPTGDGLPVQSSDNDYAIAIVGEDDDNSTQSGGTSSTRKSFLPKQSKTPQIKYKYQTFPSELQTELFGTARPLPAAVIAEFDRQRKDAAQFRRRNAMPKDAQKHIQRAHSTMDPIDPPSPEVATFTVFFMAFTALVGKELVDMAQDPNAPERTILSTYVPTTVADEYSYSEIENSESPDGDDPKEKDDVANMKASRPNMEDMFEDDDDIAEVSGFGDVAYKESLTEQILEEGKSLETFNVNKDSDESLGHALEKTKEEADPELLKTTLLKKQMEESKDLEVPDGAIDENLLTKMNSTREVDGEVAEVLDKDDADTEESSEVQPRRRFRDKLSDLEIEEAKAKGRAQLGLAFEMLTMMKKRALKADPEAYQSLIDACGRVGDTKRATDLLAKMHEDGIVADGTVYACLVSAFSAESAWKSGEKDEDLPEWANSTAVEMDWNKLQKRSFLDRLVNRVMDLEEDEDEEPDESLSSYQKLRNRLMKSRKQDTKGQSNQKPEDKGTEFYVTETVENQIALGENLLEIVFPDISVDTEDETCPRCNFELSDDAVALGWKPTDSNDYTTACPNCTQRFVPHFRVQSTAHDFLGSRGPGSPLMCERLSPWVLQKEIRSVMSDVEGINNLLDPEWRGKEYKNAVLWWNLVLSCMRYRFPFSFLLQGSFEQNLIAPMPEDES